MDIFVTRLRQAMFLRGIRQKDICERTGDPDGSLSNWYNGRYRPNAEAMAKIAKVLDVSVDYLLGKEDISPAKLALPYFREVNVIGKVAAGVPIMAQEDIIGTIMTDKNVFALRISGDSMSPRIMDGDIVLVKSQDYAEDGDLVIALIDDEATCKILKRSHGRVTLVPFNPAFAPLIYSGEDAENLRILGKVVESRHEW